MSCKVCGKEDWQWHEFQRSCRVGYSQMKARLIAEIRETEPDFDPDKFLKAGVKP